MSNLTKENAFIFRITHIDNLQWILENGLHCRNSSVRDSNYIEIGNPELISRRAVRYISEPPGGTLSDYVPFYFTPFSPMLLNIKTGWNGLKKVPLDDIIIFGSKLGIMAEQGLKFLFTDRHAYLSLAQYSSDLAELDRIDWKLLQNRDFKKDPNDPGKVERYQAEALIHKHVPISAIAAVVCRSAVAQSKLDPIVNSLGGTLKVMVQPKWYL